SSLNPGVVFVDTDSEARDLCPAVKAIEKSLPPEKDVIESCISLYELLPPAHPESPERLALLKESKTLLSDRLLRFHDYGEQLQAIGQKSVFERPSVEDIPPQIRQRFRELVGRVGLFASVSPQPTKPIHSGRHLLNYTDSLKHIHLPST